MAKEGCYTGQCELTDEQIEFYREEGYLKLEEVFDPETEGLREEFDWVVEQWAFDDSWTGDWEDQMEAGEVLTTWGLENYSSVFRRLVYDDRLSVPVSQLVGPTVEYMHSIMIAKPPQKGTPFPMHQDSSFGGEYEYDDYTNAFIYFDDAPSEKGPLAVVPGSHKNGYVEHLLPGPRGDGSNQPYLPQEQYSLDDAVELPGKAGDVLFFNVHTVHGSDLNRSDEIRRGLHIGYRNADQGQADDKRRPLVAGRVEPSEK